ncbi:hypothetical protein A2690_04960 [Candidatus Roizmanbacteria bacterium RIFCSPHIGHO2_01_FULL_39_12b]|uniref:Uncharacterized protein n=1 Tax=Candidatus Roizmanbacteria bacterium RIFCSPHIGHO2_01_FULL_39_12b TaxID=1802030 RepID=A0A1F7GD25_9BACT|nr:MAG: hypothetical protein A2690_04960 [Candidatus Roizmanbacteria bacterium RIFCSPHIGHO2_01_FULL_39_12b]OGK46265.1 MAG: hypothetical protein A3B46_01145 [Candidatus Roizmanbacteria bacterium RIFCSPLOWO2_01_FULL_39_19]
MNSQTSYTPIFTAIIKEQQMVIGPLAIERARKIPGLTIKDVNDINIKGDAQKVLGDLVNEYAKLFGKASIEVCRDAIKTINPSVSSSQLPSILQ